MNEQAPIIAQNPVELTETLSKVLKFKVENLVRLSGGASQETWSFDVPDRSEGAGLILRRSPHGISKESETALPLTAEAALISAAARAGVPVPAIVHVCGPEDGLGEGFIMSRLEGETIPRKILRDEDFAEARGKLARQCGQALAGIHPIPCDGIPGLRDVGPEAMLAQYEGIYRDFGDPHPVFELAIRWLKDNMPSTEASALVHGDFRNGNIIVGPEGLRAVLDWELAHIGDPMEDLAWLCVNSWRFGEVDKPVGGFGSREDLFKGYEEAGGTVDPDRVHFWEVLGTLKWGIMCIIMVGAFRGGIDRSVERAAIGRRASETEIDLLNLLTR